MRDEGKTRKQFIDEITSLRLKIPALEQAKDRDAEPDQNLRRILEWKDFLLGLHEKAVQMATDDLFNYVLDQVVRLTDSTIGFCHLVADDQQSISMTIWNQEALKNGRAFHDVHYPLDLAGHWAECVHSKYPTVYNEFSHTSDKTGLPEGHIPVHRLMSIPVLEHDKVRIILGVGNKADAYDEQDILQTQLVANNLQTILERRHAEEKLREREERLSLTLKVTRDGIWDWNIAKSIGYASPVYYTMLGYDPGEIPLRFDEWWGFVHPDDIPRVREAIDRAKQTPSTIQDDIQTIEFRMKMKNGGWRWILGRGMAVEWDGEGRPVRMVGTHTDIEKRKQAEEALRESEERYRTLFETANDAIMLMDDELVVVDCNSRTLEMGDFPEHSDIIGHTPFEFFPISQPDSRESRSAPLAYVKAAFAGQPQKFFWRTFKKEGAILDLDVSLNALTLAGKRYLQVVARDVTERRLAEAELRESQRRLSDIIEFLPDATLVINRDGRVLAWNRAMEAMTGVKKENMLGKGNFEYALPFYGVRRPMLIDCALHQDEEPLKRYAALRRIGNTLFGEVRTILPGEISVSATASVLRDSQGILAGAIECIRDITEQVHLESQLRQAQKMEAIGTLAGGIAHDFNNILASIIGYTELAVINRNKTNLQERNLEQVLRACERAKNLINQILVLSRQREQERIPVDMRGIVKETLKLMRASLPTTIKISQHMASEPLTVMADPTQIHQIILNLCTNAAHAMRENGGDLEVTLSGSVVSDEMAAVNPACKAGPYARLMVKDSGHGIDPAIVDKIFDPFFTTKGQGEGTGLGLSVVYGIVKSHDGVIQVKSDPGQGATFQIHLPAMEEVKSAGEKKVVQAVPGGRESILLVDDEELLVTAMEQYLRALGYDSVSVTDSSEALDMVIENPCRFDLIITDMTMPHMTGLNLSRKVLSINPSVPIILCTGFNETITEAEARENGIREFVLKPIPLKQLARLVRQVFDGA